MENYQSKIIIIMPEQEVFLDEIEQEIKTPPRNDNEKTSTEAKVKGKTRKRYTLDIPVADIRAKRVSLCAQLGRKITKLLYPLAHHCQQHSTSAGAITPNNVGSCCVCLHVALISIVSSLTSLKFSLDTVSSNCHGLYY